MQTRLSAHLKKNISKDNNNMSNYVAAIDLGTTKVVTIVGEKSAGGIKIIGYSEFPSNGIKRGEVINIQKVLDAITPTINDVRNQIEDYEFDIKEVFIGVAGQSIKCIAANNKKMRFNPEEIISESEVASWTNEMYNYSVSNLDRVLHVIPQYYNVDEHMYITDIAGMEGKDIEGFYRLFVGRSNAVKSSYGVMARKDLKVKRAILEPIASARAVVSKDDMELGVAIVDIGGGTTDLLIVQDNIIRHTAVIPFGGNSITEDIRQICGVSFKDAEALKKQHGSCLSQYAQESKVINISGKDGGISKQVPCQLLASVIEARISEIIATVAYEIEESGFKEKLRSGIVITGGSSNLNHLQVLAKHITGMEVRISQPDKSVIMNTSCEDAFKASSSTAVGLVLSAFDYLEDEEEFDNITPYAHEDEEPFNRDLFGNKVEENPVDKPKTKTSRQTSPKAPKKSLKERLKDTMDGIFNAANSADDDEA